MPDVVYKALRPMLAASGGDWWMLSTPCGKRGFFYENWEHGGEEWERTAAPATECPRISQTFLEEERRQLGEIWFRQECLCEFVDNGLHLFDRHVVMGAMEEIEVLEV